MDHALHVFEKILRNNSYSLTHARKTVFCAIWDHEPQSMHDIELTAAQSIDRTSIYRSVELFEKLGIIQKVQIGWKYKIELSDIFIKHHHHISCLQCGKVIAVHMDDKIELLINEIAVANNISSPTHQLEIQGVCQECAQLNSSSRKL